MGGLGGAEDCFVRGRGHAEGDIFAQGLAEEEGLLRDEADVAAQGLQRVIAQLAAVEEHLAFGSVVEPGDEADQG